ncbi:MAG: DUF3828 domain-containing protein [Burkholderiaceae bacterium]|nr:MAG: DUF3828 domain-containing protein [Burkholderiaceae bacterium]
MRLRSHVFRTWALAFSALGLMQIETANAQQASPTSAAQTSTTQTPQQSEALALLTQFYTDYLNLNIHTNPNAKVPSLPFTRAFNNELRKNKLLCRKHQDEICGFAADGDPYLDAQDFSDGLNAKNARLKLDLLSKENAKNKALIRVHFFLFPDSNTDERNLLYRLKYEEGTWRVDDIIYGPNSSARQQIRDEIRSLLKDAKGQ